MTADDFRRLALRFPETSEGAHMGHPDYRVNGRVFATLHGTGTGRGMVKLSPEEQHNFVRTHPGAFAPENGAWGRQGCTTVFLEEVDADAVRNALEIAWRCATAMPRPKTRPGRRK